MVTYRPLPDYPVTDDERIISTGGSASGVSWGAIFVGAAGAAALSLVLVILGFGLGLSSVSPWSNAGASAAAIGFSTIAWLAFTQVAASAVGGYLAGRLRVKWTRLHSDEVYFRDTAHGFMAWAVASLATVALLGSALAGIVGVGAHASGALANGAGMAAMHARMPGGQGAGGPDGAAGPDMGRPDMGGSGLDYAVDAIFRRDAAHMTTSTSPSTRAEAVKIFATDLHTGTLTDEDRTYLGSVVAQETGLAQADAEKRVSDKFNQTKAAITDAENTAKQAADTARKAAAHASLWMFVALMLGAFFASLAATFGGRRRDLHA